MLWGALTATAKVTCMILVIMSAAALFSQLLSMTGALDAVTEAVAEADLPRWVMLAIMLLLPFILCMFLDQIALMLVFIPIFAPLILILEFDPVWFWVLRSEEHTSELQSLMRISYAVFCLKKKKNKKKEVQTT